MTQQAGRTKERGMARMTITKRNDGDGALVWTNDKNNGFIAYTPDAPDGDTPTPEGMYVAARLGDRRFWCEDAKGYVYSFASLIGGSASAPAYMRRMAREVRRQVDAW